MEELFKELIQAHENSWIDILGVFLPIIVSIVAIWISIGTTAKQNKIALFKERYRVFGIILFLLPVGKELLNNTNEDDYSAWDVLASGMQNYNFINTPCETEIDFGKIQYFYTNLVLEAVKVQILYGKEKTDVLVSFLTTFDNIVSKVCNGDLVVDEKKSLQEALNEIEKTNICKTLEKYLKM